MAETTEIVNAIVDKHGDSLDNNSLQFCKRVYATDESVYAKRIKAIGCVDKKKVLDAGCGFGQWSVQLAKLNEEVVSMDISQARVDLLKDVAEGLNLDNISTDVGSLEKLPFEDNSFDAIFCYGVVFLCKWKNAIKEFSRVLKKDGVLYTNANGLGWYIHLWKNQPNAAKNYNPQEWAARAFVNTLNYNNDEPISEVGGVIINRQEMREELKKNNFEVLAVDDEGKINVQENGEAGKSFFLGEYEGHEGVFEVLAQKQ